MATMNNKQLEAIVPYLETFESKDFSPGTWNNPPGEMPWYSLDASVSEFLQKLDDNGWISKSFKWTKWQETAMEYVETPSLLEQANSKTIQRLFTTHVRKEHFCEGHLAAMFENGHMVALLRRLKAIRSGTPSETSLPQTDRNQLIETIRELLGSVTKEETSVNGSMTFVSGDPGEVIVRLKRNKVSVSMFAVVWEHVHKPVVKPKEWATLNWKLIPTAQLTLCLQTLMNSVRQVRLAKYRKCEFCGIMKPPEWQHDEKTCMSCAERHLGVVH